MKKRILVGCGIWFLLFTFNTAYANLLGVNVSTPLISFTSTSPTATTYDPVTHILTITATPGPIQFTSTESPKTVVNPRSMTIRIRVDNSGALIGGVSAPDLVISGAVQRIVGTTTNLYQGSLLEGTVTAFGSSDSGGTVDNYDLRFTPTGGKLLSFYSCGTIGVTVIKRAIHIYRLVRSSFSRARQRVHVGLEDLTPPSITCPFADAGSVTNVECNASSGGQHGAYVSYPAPMATDNCDTNITFVYSPPSGSFFPLDPNDIATNYTVTLTATDSSGNQTNCSFTVTVKDTESPLFDDNENPLIEPCAIDRLTFSNDVGKCYATVTLMKPTASDCCSLNVNISVSAVDEHNVVIPLTDLGGGMLQGQFPVSHDGGTNWVTVVADDGRGNTSQSRCPVIVKDTEAPVINCQDIVIVATNCTTVCNPQENWHCSMKYGHHAFNCSPDRYGHCHQKCGTIVFNDDRGCGIRGGSWLRRKCQKFGHWWCDKDQDDCEPVTGAVVPVPTVSDNCDDEVDVMLNPPAGTPLGVGVTTVTVTAVDDAGNTSTCTFKVTVLSGIKVVFSCDLDDDNKADNIETDADIRNRFDVCDRVPVRVTLRDICTGQMSPPR